MNAFSYPSLPAELSHLREKVNHIITNTNMLCCGYKKESRTDVNRQHIIGEESAYYSLAHHQHQHHHHQQAIAGGSGGGVGQHSRKAIHHSMTGGVHPSGGHQIALRSRMPEMVLQSDFRKVSGISSEIFRQIEAVENDFDSTTAAYFDSVEKRGEMVIRRFDPKMLGKAGLDESRKYMNDAIDVTHSVQFVEIIKRPGQTLGLYIREGDGYHCNDGVFISRIAIESAVYNSGLLKVGDKILAVNLVDVRRMSLDDVVIIMSIPRRLVLTIRSRLNTATAQSPIHRKSLSNDYRNLPVVVVKRKVHDEQYDESNSQLDSENGHLLQARLKGLPVDVPDIAVPLDGEQPVYDRPLPQNTGTLDDHSIYYNSQPQRLRTATYNRSDRSVAPTYNIRDDLWSDYRTSDVLRGSRPYGIVTQQPNLLQRQYPKTLENLAEHVHQFYSGYSSDVPQSSSHRRSGSTLQVTRASVHRPPSSGRQRYWEDYKDYKDYKDYAAQHIPVSGDVSGSLRRTANIHRTESNRGLPPTMSDDFLNRYMKSSLRRGETGNPSGYQGLVSMQDLRSQRARDDLRASASTQTINSILRRKTYFDGSASDTEVTTTSPNPYHYLLRQRSLGPYSRMFKVASRDSFQFRSSSLPRTKPTISSDYRYSSRTPPASVSASASTRRTHQQRQSVRFERQPFEYDDDSDGAVSAPELPPTRLRRIGRRATSPNVNLHSSDEYRQWMVRAPSTSAIYETVRKLKALPLSSNSLNKIAHSAESLLDAIRIEQQRT